jgi:hypothetical protein
MGGVDQQALGRILSIQRAPSPIDVDTANLHEDFARTMRAYLVDLTGKRAIELADLAAAILRAGRDDSSGLLPGRLKELAVDYERVIPAIDRLISHRRQISELRNAEDFSASVRQVRDRLGGEANVTAARIAQALQAGHPGYGGGRFQKVSLRPAAGPVATTDEWLDRVRSLYTMAEVSRTRHQVIDGELTLLGLAELDVSLAENLRDGGFLDALSAGAQVRPRRVTSDRTEWAPDAPAEEDLLGRERLAEVLANRVRLLAEPESPSKRSFLVHLDGPWGSGKSTLFGFLKRQLELERGFLVVGINAWREQRIGVPWWTLLSTLRRTIASAAPWYARPWAWFAGLLDRIRAGWMPFAAALLVVGALLIWLVSVVRFDLTASGDAAESILKVLSVSSAAFAGLVPRV